MNERVKALIKQADSRIIRWFLSGTIVAMAAFGVYANTLLNGFVWDDLILIVKNPFIQDWGNVSKILSIDYFLTPMDVENGARPMWVLSALLDYKWWGLLPAGHHLTNVVLHTFNSLLVFALAAFLSKRPAPGGSSLIARPLRFSFIAGLLFAVHPIHTEAVSVVGFRADLLATLFFLSAFLLYVGTFSVQGMARLPLQFIFVCLSLGCYALGLLSKEIAITLPVVLILHDFYFVSSFKWRPLLRRIPVYGAYLLICPFYLQFHSGRFFYGENTVVERWVSKLISLLTFASPAKAEAMGSPTLSLAQLLHGDPLTNFFTMSKVFAQYVKLLLWPSPLRAEYAIPLSSSVFDPAVLASLALLLGLFAAAVLIARKHPMLSFSVLAFFVLLLPVSNIQPIYNLMAERYLYLPSLMFCFAAAYAAVRLYVIASEARQSLKSRIAVPFGFALVSIFIALSVLTFDRNTVWRDEKALWQVTSRQSPAAARVWYNLAFLAQQENDLNGAKRLYRKALTINPNYIEARHNLIALLSERPDGRQKIKEGYEALLARKPNAYLPYLNYAVTLMKEGGFSEAVPVLREIQKRFPYDAYPHDRVGLSLAKCYAIIGDSERSEKEFRRVFPDLKEWAQTRYDLGAFFDDNGQYAEAERQYREALKSRPGWAEAKASLGVALHHQGRLAEALVALREAAELNPNRPATFYNLGVVQSDMSEFVSAEESFKKAIKLHRDYDDAHYNLAVVYQRQGRRDDAIRSYEETIRIKPDRVAALSNLGGCYIDKGDLEKAEMYCRRAIKADPLRSGPYVNLGGILMRRGDIDGAMSSFQQAIRVDPLDVMAYNNLGLCFLEKGEYKKAQQEFISAIKADSRFADAYFHLGLAFRFQGMKQDAVEALRIALSINPQHQRALMVLREIQNEG